MSDLELKVQRENKVYLECQVNLEPLAWMVSQV